MLPEGLHTDPALVAAYREPRLLRMIDLLRKVVLVITEPDSQAELRALARVYGAESLEKVLGMIGSRSANMGLSPFDDEVRSYTEYIERYNRYGGQQSFLSFPEYDLVQGIFMRGNLLPGFVSPLTSEERQRAQTARILCIADGKLMDGVVPHNPPPSPVSEVLSEETLAQIRAVIDASEERRRPRSKRRGKKRRR